MEPIINFNFFNFLKKKKLCVVPLHKSPDSLKNYRTINKGVFMGEYWNKIYKFIIQFITIQKLSRGKNF